MGEFKVILILVGFALIFGVLLFFLLRLFLMKGIKQQKEKGVRVGVKEAGSAVLVATVLLVIFWFETAGHRWAAIAFSAIMLASNLVALYVLRGRKKIEK